MDVNILKSLRKVVELSFAMSWNFLQCFGIRHIVQCRGTQSVDVEMKVVEKGEVVHQEI